ncbi:hypothetical protein UFOVP1254_25 [uncultured Caudovirales phage]|uniref:Uncharacterized protein n=1 Tax=uncultured Caudovirales phage TaxID=2100421 RepID=A0A6J5RJK4_9CAUD|nr:hypothetical protein UFOVP1254_25 [uncultured Caudovirales phage]
MATTRKSGTVSAKGTKLVQNAPVAQTQQPANAALQQTAAAQAIGPTQQPAAAPQQNAGLVALAQHTHAAAAGAAGTVQAATAPSAGTQTRLAVQAAGPAAGFAAVGVNGRKWPALGPVTQQIWQAALAYQLASPTQALPSAGKNSTYTVALVAAGVKATSVSCGLTQYKAYTGQNKGAAPLTLAQLQALATANAS